MSDTAFNPRCENTDLFHGLHDSQRWRPERSEMTVGWIARRTPFQFAFAILIGFDIGLEQALMT
jgi:hypothetical protein